MTLITPALTKELTLLYSEPARHYHSIKHVNALLDLLATYRRHFTDPDAVEAAIWFHDAVYDPRAQGHANELESAKLAVDRLSGSDGLSVDAERLMRIRKMIEATATHTVPASLNEAEAADAAMFLDMDLSILGADETTFDEYEAAVRKEYDFVAEDAWRAGRMAVLKRFGERERIYHSELFRGLFEDAARRNLKRSIERLDTRPGDVH
ncbi:Phosphohydrolase [Madurella fahalii]|uniref:Phosphohydrolase n=1 Tax=Madurella fahalii TaxID=1157608 RepID=A0ABQ0GLC9_9PEZI